MCGFFFVCSVFLSKLTLCNNIVLGLSVEDEPSTDNILTVSSPTSVVIGAVCRDLAVSDRIYPLL